MAFKVPFVGKTLTSNCYNLIDDRRGYVEHYVESLRDFLNKTRHVEGKQYFQKSVSRNGPSVLSSVRGDKFAESSGDSQSHRDIGKKSHLHFEYSFQFFFFFHTVSHTRCYLGTILVGQKIRILWNTRLSPIQGRLKSIRWSDRHPTRYYSILLNSGLQFGHDKKSRIHSTDGTVRQSRKVFERIYLDPHKVLLKYKLKFSEKWITWLKTKT